MADALAAGARRRSLANTLSVATPPPKGSVKRIHKKSPASVGASESTTTPDAKRILVAESSGGSKGTADVDGAAAPTAPPTTPVELFPGDVTEVVEVVDTQIDDEPGVGHASYCYIYIYMVYLCLYIYIYLYIYMYNWVVEIFII